MVQTVSHRFNTHVKRLSLSASVVIITTHASLQLVESSHNISIIYCYSIFPPVHSNWWAIITFPILQFMAWNIRKLIWIPNSWLFEYVYQVILYK